MNKSHLKPATPEERKALLAKPFPPIGGAARNVGPSYPWAGTIVNDNFYHDGRESKRRGSEDRITQYEIPDYDF